MAKSESVTEQIEQRINSEGFSLPMFNQVALELRRAFEKDVSLDAAEEMILKDPALASEVLRVANSAFYLGLSKVENIRQALVRLGTEQVVSIAMLASQREMFKTKNVFFKQIMSKLWQQATASAEGCRWIAKKYGFSSQKEIAFLCGLLHDIGSLVILKVLEELFEDDPEIAVTEALIMELIDALHPKYGHQVMQSWELPEMYCDIALNHHLAAGESDDVLLQTVRLVDAACAKLSIGLNPDPDIVLEALPEVYALGIKNIHLAELEIQLEDFSAQFA